VSDERAEFESERNGRNELLTRRDVSSGDSVPRPLGFIASMPIPANDLQLGFSFRRTPAWSWPRSRRSGCFPAEPYLSLRPLVVYPQGCRYAMVERKKDLIIAALSDMADIRNLLAKPTARLPQNFSGRRWKLIRILAWFALVQVA